MSNNLEWISCVSWTIITLACFIMEGVAVCDVADNMDSLFNVESLGCWKDTLEHKHFLSSSSLAFDFSKNVEKKTCGHSTSEFVAECAKLTKRLGYSVFFISYGLKQSCLTGAHAAQLYTGYDMSMKVNCSGRTKRVGRTYIYSTIGTFSDIFSSDEADRTSQFTRKQTIESPYVTRESLNNKAIFAEQTSHVNMLPPQFIQNKITKQVPMNIQTSQNHETESTWHTIPNQPVDPSLVKTNANYGGKTNTNYGGYQVNRNVEGQQKIPENVKNPGNQQAVLENGKDPNALTTSNIFETKPEQNITLQDLVFPWLDSMNSPDHKGNEVDEIKFLEEKPEVSPETENLLRNPSFEDALIPDSLTGWLCQGQSNDPASGVLSQVYSTNHGQGESSGMCSKRAGRWAGPGQYIGRFLKPDTNYKFSCWVGLEAEKQLENAEQKHIVQVWLRYKYRDNNKVQHKLLSKTYQLVNDPLWKHIYADFQIPPVTKRVKYVFLYIDGPSTDVNIRIDDCNLAAFPSADSWKQISDDTIDKVRKRSVKIRLILPKPPYSDSDVAATRIQIKQKNNLFAFGAAIHHWPIFKIPQYQKFFLDNFQWGVLESEMKWTSTEAERGNIDYTIPDKMVEFLENNNKTIRGHCIVWAVPESQPTWLHGLLPRQTRESVEKRVDDVVAKYRGKLKHWDVNNEMLHGDFFTEKLRDPSISQWMFHRVKELDPGAKLFVNDFEVVSSSLLTKAYVDHTNDLLKQNVPIEGLGAQGHFTGVVDPIVLKHRLDLLTETNVPIWLTEVDIVEPDPHKRAISLENIMRVAFSHQGVHGILFWCFWNKHCWRGSKTGLVEDDDFKLTEAGRVYQDLRRQWTTDEELKPSHVINNEGHFVFRGFHGDYDMFIHLPDGKVIAKNFTIEPGDTDFPLKVHVYERV